MTIEFRKVAVLGATGYVGGRLVPRLLEKGYSVVAISRSRRKLAGRPWASHPRIELKPADATDESALGRALEGVDTVYYLVHSMGPAKDFRSTDSEAALSMSRATANAGCQRVIYLGGLGEPEDSLSPHLASRAEVASLLAQGSVPVTTLRAAMIIGSGSASFEMLRYLVDRLPLMVTPRWVSTPCQPIAIRNVLDYLIGVLEREETVGRSYDIGGPEVTSYRHLMELYSDVAQLGRRWIVPVPVFTPKLSSYWINLVTPVPAALARPLAEGLKNPVICRDDSIRNVVPIRVLSYREAMELALQNMLAHTVESHWTDAGALPPEETVYPGDATWSGGTVYSDRRKLTVTAPIETVWQAIVGIGGKNGWYYGNMLWRLRGWMDKLAGGVGSRRGRRDPSAVQPGDALDFWRVLSVTPHQQLRLLAEMKLPGQALLDFQLTSLEGGKTAIQQTAWFVPTGLSGILYWWAVTPFHNFVFSGMLRGIARQSGGEILEGPEACTVDQH